MDSSEASTPSSSSNTDGYMDGDGGELILAENNPKRRAGRKKFKETRHPVYRGISRRNSGKWVCEVREPNTKTRVWLGTHPTAEMAARAHDVAVLAMRGRSACLNFADSPSRLPVSASNDIKDIQKAAAEAAEAFRPKEDGEGAEEAQGSGEGSYYVDEEEIFEMPDFLASMAEGLMISPPRTGNYTDDVECGDDGSLWSFD